MVAGQYNNPQTPLMELWNGTRWEYTYALNERFEVVGDGALWGIGCGSESMCVAVGVTSGARAQALIWNGGFWTIQFPPSPGTSQRLLEVSCPLTTFCMAVGEYRNEVRRLPLAAKYA